MKVTSTTKKKLKSSDLDKQKNKKTVGYITLTSISGMDR